MTVDSRIRELESSGPLRYGVHVYASADITGIVTGVATVIPFDTVVSDAFSIWADASQDYRFKVPVGGAGLYIAEFFARWSSSSTTSPTIGIRVYDTAAVLIEDQGSRSNTADTVASPVSQVTTILALEEQQEVETWAVHASGADRVLDAQSTATVPRSPSFKMYRFSR